MRQHPDYVYRPKRKQRLAPKSVNHSSSPRTKSCIKQTESVVDNRISPNAVQLILASEAQKQQSLQQQSLVLAYNTQLLAEFIKETQRKKVKLIVFL